MVGLSTRVLLALAALVLAVVLLPPKRAAGADAGETFYFQPKWTHIVSRQGDLVENTLNIQNRGDSSVSFVIEFAEAPDWNIELRGANTNFQVRGVIMAPGDLLSMPLEFRIPRAASPRDYQMVLTATSVDGDFVKRAEMLVTVLIDERRQALLQPTGNVELQAPRYTSLTGTQDSDFEFGVVIKNGTKEDVDLDLGAVAPAGWTVGFVPSFDPDQLVAALAIEAGTSESVTAQIRPTANTDPGSYGVQFTAIGEEVQLSTAIKIEIIGFSQLQIGLPSGGRPIEAAGGASAPAAIVVTSIGNLPIGNVALDSKAPEGWEVSFEPSRLPVLNRDEVREVDVQISPAADAPAGDYRVTLLASAEGTSHDVDLFVTVTRRSIWSWAGLVIALAAMAGVAGLFVALGRR